MQRAMNDIRENAERETAVRMRHGHLEKVREKLNKQWEWSPVDKNPRKGFQVCKTLYAKLPEDIYYDPVQFEPIASLGSKKDAMNTAKDMLFQNAMKCDVDQFFKGQGTTAAPSTFIFIKNKSNEHARELKCRVVFSYARHPMRAIGTQEGRALNVFIAEGQQCMQSFEMPQTSDVKGWVKQTNMVPQHKCIRDPQALKIWELDVREMFPRLSKGQIENIFHRPRQRGASGDQNGVFGRQYNYSDCAHWRHRPTDSLWGPPRWPEQVNRQVGQVGERV